MSIQTNASLTITSGPSAGTLLSYPVTGLSLTGVQQALTQQTIGVAPPATPVLTAGTGGSLGAGTFYVKLTYANAPQGESLPSVEASVVVSASGKITITSPVASGSAQGYNVYIGSSSGAETKQNSSIVPIGSNYVQSATLSGGSALPGSDTTLTYAPTLTQVPCQVVSLKNVSSGSQSIAVTWTTQGGTSNKALDLLPGAALFFLEPVAGIGIGGISALSLLASADGAKVEMFLGG